MNTTSGSASRPITWGQILSGFGAGATILAAAGAAAVALNNVQANAESLVGVTEDVEANSKAITELQIENLRKEGTTALRVQRIEDGQKQLKDDLQDILILLRQLDSKAIVLGGEQ